MLYLYPKGMNVSLTDELETVIEEKVKSGLYNNASEVVRDALRRTFCQPLRHKGQLNFCQIIFRSAFEDHARTFDIDLACRQRDLHLPLVGLF